MQRSSARTASLGWVGQWNECRIPEWDEPDYTEGACYDVIWQFLLRRSNAQEMWRTEGFVHLHMGFAGKASGPCTEAFGPSSSFWTPSWTVEPWPEEPGARSQRRLGLGNIHCFWLRLGFQEAFGQSNPHRPLKAALPSKRPSHWSKDADARGFALTFCLLLLLIPSWMLGYTWGARRGKGRKQLSAPLMAVMQLRSSSFGLALPEAAAGSSRRELRVQEQMP
eukprot:g9354.t1